MTLRRQNVRTRVNQETAEAAQAAQQNAQASKGENVQTSQEEDTKTSKSSDAQTSDSIDALTTRTQDVETERRLDVQTLNPQDAQVPSSVDVPTSEGDKPLVQETFQPQNVSTSSQKDVREFRRPKQKDVQTSKNTRRPEKEEGRQTAYFEPELRRWVKHRAIDEDMTISELILKAMQEYRARVERRKS